MNQLDPTVIEHLRDMVNSAASDGFSGDAFVVGVQETMTLLETERLTLIRQVTELMDGVSVSQFATSGQCDSYRQACLDVLEILEKGTI